MNPNDRQEELLPPDDAYPPAEVTVAPATEASPLVGTGAQLRAAREALGLSVSDAAHAIRLNPRQVQNLEDEAWGALPGPTFVRGFLRNYARFLKLDPEPLLAGLARIEQPALEVAREEGVEDNFEPDPQRSGSLLLILGGALVVVALAVYFLVPAGTFETAPQGAVASAPPAAATPPAATPPAATPPADAAPPIGKSAAVPPAEPTGARAPDAARSTAAVQPALVAPAATRPAPATVAAPARSAPAAVASTTPAAAPAPAAVTSAAPAAATSAVSAPATPAVRAAATPAVSAAAAAAGPTPTAADAAVQRVAVDGPERQIVFTVSELSWVEVLDAGGNQILAHNLDNGRRRSVRGVAPLQVIIGNAAGVAVTVDGQAVDIKPHTRANVTRLTVE